MTRPAGEQRAGLSTGAERGIKLDFDTALRVTVPEGLAEVVGAALMEMLGPFELLEAPPGMQVSAAEEPLATLIFYPPPGVGLSAEEVLHLLPASVRKVGTLRVESVRVPRDWVDGWKAHFCPQVIGAVRVRPPWEPPGEARWVDVVINPGLGFGTGSHPTTRGTLLLLQTATAGGPLVDVGTGSGILAITAAKLGWAPVIAFDNDSQALLSARENVAINGVRATVQVMEMDLTRAPTDWFAGATVLANLTLGPVLVLLERLRAARDRGSWPRRLIVSGILVGEQEERLREAACRLGWAGCRRISEGEWVAQELVPAGVDKQPGAPREA